MQKQSSYKSITSEAKVLYSCNPRTTTFYYPFDRIISFSKISNIPFYFESSYIHLQGDVWPSVEITMKVPDMSGEATSFANSITVDNNSNKFFIINNIYNYTVEEDYFGFHICQMVLDIYQNYLDDNSEINNNFLQSSYNPEGIFTGVSSDLYRKLIVLPSVKNTNKIIKSDISITPTVNLSHGSIIRIALPSFNNKTDIDIEETITNKWYNINLNNTYNSFYTDDDILLKCTNERIDNVIKSPFTIVTPNYEDSVYFINSTAINLFDCLFVDANRDVNFMAVSYNDPVYQEHVITRDISAGEEYSFEMISPLTISNQGIVYHLEVPQECSFSVKPYFIELSMTYPSVTIPSNNFSLVITPEIVGDFICSSTDILEYFILSSNGNITCNVEVPVGIYEFTVEGTYETNKVSADVKITVLNNSEIIYYNDVYNISVDEDINISGNPKFEGEITSDDLPMGLAINTSGEITGSISKPDIYNLTIKYEYGNLNYNCEVLNTVKLNIYKMYEINVIANIFGYN